MASTLDDDSSSRIRVSPPETRMKNVAYNRNRQRKNVSHLNPLDDGSSIRTGKCLNFSGGCQTFPVVFVRKRLEIIGKYQEISEQEYFCKNLRISRFLAKCSDLKTLTLTPFSIPQ